MQRTRFLPGVSSRSNIFLRALLEYITQPYDTDVSTREFAIEQISTGIIVLHCKYTYVSLNDNKHNKASRR